MFLKEWRLHAAMTLEHVAEALGTSHTTVLRWEAGQHRVPAAVLTSLEALYGATGRELTLHPRERVLAARLDRADKVVRALDAESAEAWLAVGAVMARRTEPRSE